MNDQRKYQNMLDHKAIDHIDAMISQWVASLADQVKNPVAGISAALSIVSDELNSFSNTGELEVHKTRTAIDLMFGRLHALNAYISEVSDFARPVEINPSTYNTTELIEDAIKTFSNSPHKHTDIHVDIAPNVKDIYCDREKFEKILNALFYNASEAVGSTNKPVVHLIAQNHQTEDKDGVVIKVCDNGPGINEEDVEFIVRPFVSSKEASSGMGLAVCKKFAKAHGGWLKIKSSPLSSGAMIVIFFPNKIKK